MEAIRRDRATAANGARRAVAEEPAVAAACVIYVIDDGEPEMVRKLGDGGEELRKVATAGYYVGGLGPLSRFPLSDRAAPHRCDPDGLSAAGIPPGDARAGRGTRRDRTPQAAHGKAGTVAAVFVPSQPITMLRASQCPVHRHVAAAIETRDPRRLTRMLHRHTAARQVSQRQPRLGPSPAPRSRGRASMVWVGCPIAGRSDHQNHTYGDHLRGRGR